MTRRLEGAKAVVVGAGQTAGETIGNGRATAIAFAREGAELLLVDLDTASLSETKELVGKEGGRATTLVLDIADDGASEKVAKTALEYLGRVDILHNNVGIGLGDTGAVSLEPEVYDRIMNVNLRAMWLTSRQILPIMREQSAGCILNISSVAALRAPSSMTAYRLSKVGVNALTEQLAITNARFGIRVISIMPGLMDTPMAVDAVAASRGLTREDVAEARSGRVPLRGRMGTAWDVAYAAVFLCSKEAQFITGIHLAVDGGQLLAGS